MLRVWETISIKGFSSPNVSIRALVTAQNVSQMKSEGKSQGGVSKLGASKKPIRALSKMLTLLLMGLQSPTTTLNEPE